MVHSSCLSPLITSEKTNTFFATVKQNWRDLGSSSYQQKAEATGKCKISNDSSSMQAIRGTAAGQVLSDTQYNLHDHIFNIRDFPTSQRKGLM
jgi:hypothetical protein